MLLYTNFHILTIVTYLIAFIFVNIFIFFYGEPRGPAYWLMHLFIYEENRWIETASLFMFNTAVTAAEATKTTKYARAG